MQFSEKIKLRLGSRITNKFCSLWYNKYVLVFLQDFKNRRRLCRKQAIIASTHLCGRFPCGKKAGTGPANAGPGPVPDEVASATSGRVPERVP